MKTFINCRGKILDLTSPKIMGVINLNADSFYESSQSHTIPEVIKNIGQMIDEGVDIIDIGAMSSKPGSVISDPIKEKNKIVNLLKEIRQIQPNILISIDTLHSSVAAAALENGADIINDITAGDYDNQMMDVIARYQVPFIMMHIQGLPENMQDNPSYDDVTMEIFTYFKNKIRHTSKAGIEDVIIDPGFGFGKTVSHNYGLLKNLEVFQIFDVPVLCGISRKSMIWKPLEITPDTALNGTSVLNFYALQKGASILRVHDVKEAKEVIKLFELLKSAH